MVARLHCSNNVSPLFTTMTCYILTTDQTCPSIGSFFFWNRFEYFFILSRSGTQPYNASFDQKGLERWTNCSKCMHEKQNTCLKTKIFFFSKRLLRMLWLFFIKKTCIPRLLNDDMDKLNFVYAKIAVNNKERVSSLFSPTHIELRF
jgi:hypothetical protein